jgi:hypothetical protein
MEYVYDLTGAEPIIRDVRLYDAATIARGELVILGTTDPDSNADMGLAGITGYSATAANSALGTIGVCQETLTTASTVSIASAPDSAPCYGKVIINPFAVYRAEHALDAANDVAITSTSTTTLTVPSLADDIDGFWAYLPLTTAGVKGSLRLITAAASGSCTMDSALTTNGSGSDTVVLIAPELKYSFNLDSTATKISSSNCQAANEATNIRVLQSFIDQDQGLEILRPAVHKGLNNLHLVKGGTGPKFFYDIVCNDHIFNGVKD